MKQIEAAIRENDSLAGNAPTRDSLQEQFKRAHLASVTLFFARQHGRQQLISRDWDCSKFSNDNACRQISQPNGIVKLQSSCFCRGDCGNYGIACTRHIENFPGPRRKAVDTIALDQRYAQFA